MTITALVAKQPLCRPARGADVRAVQLALRSAGAELVVDGDFGGITEAAVKRFQAAHALLPDGQVGALTAQALDAIALAVPVQTEPLPSSKATAPWLSVMRAITGTKEIPGSADSLIILSWRNKIIADFPDMAPGVRDYTHDSIPWCGLTVAYALAAAGFHPALEPLYATNNFYAWRDGVHLKGPALGSIVVMTRNGGGHVTMYEGEDDNYWFGRGGNQSDMVNVSRFPKSRPILGHMWPKAAPFPDIGPVRRTFAGAVDAVKES